MITRRAAYRGGRIAPGIRPALLLALLWTVCAHAHQQKESITRLLFNERTQNLEVMHRFYLHDAEHAVRELLGPEADILGSAESRTAFANYVHERFELRDQAGRTLVLTPVGEEIEGRFLWIYAETPIPARLTALTISHDALRDLWPEQVNLVNVDREGETQSALFAGGTRALQITIP